MSNSDIPILPDPNSGNGVPQTTPQPVPIKINMGYGPGFVQIDFAPPAERVRFDPKSARSFAIALLGNADAAEAPPPPLIQTLDPGPIIPIR